MLALKSNQKRITQRLTEFGMLESSYSRTKAIGYPPIHTRIMVPHTDNPEMTDFTTMLLELGFCQSSTFSISSNWHVTLFVKSGAHITVNHSTDDEVISATIQYLDD